MTGVVPRSRLPVPVLLLFIAGIMVALYGADRFLANLEQQEVEREAERLSRQGAELMKQGKAREAAQLLQRAHSMVRGNRSFTLELAQAEFEAGRPDSARALVETLLDHDPNDAQANLQYARILSSQGSFRDAASYYHRAIYGSWPKGSEANRLETRFELAGFLAGHGTEQELLSEVLSLQSEAPDSPATTKRIADLFLEAGSAARAAHAYRDLVRKEPDDTAAWIGLGRAELLTGNYRAAESAFRTAQHHQPNDSEVKRGVELANRLAALDPSVRHLGSNEKLRRSEQILDMSFRAIEACLAGRQEPPHLHSLVESARRLRAERHPGPATDEQAEQRLDAAQALWRSREWVCSAPPASDDPLPAIMRKLGQ